MKMQVDLAEMRADLVELKMGLDREHYFEKGQQAEQRRGESEVVQHPSYKASSTLQFLQPEKISIPDFRKFNFRLSKIQFQTF